METLTDHILLPCPDCGQHLIPVYIGREVVKQFVTLAVTLHGAQ